MNLLPKQLFTSGPPNQESSERLINVFSLKPDWEICVPPRNSFDQNLNTTLTVHPTTHHQKVFNRTIVNNFPSSRTKNLTFIQNTKGYRGGGGTNIASKYRNLYRTTRQPDPISLNIKSVKRELNPNKLTMPKSIHKRLHNLTLKKSPPIGSEDLDEIMCTGRSGLDFGDKNNSVGHLRAGERLFLDRLEKNIPGSDGLNDTRFSHTLHMNGTVRDQQMTIETNSSARFRPCPNAETPEVHGKIKMPFIYQGKNNNCTQNPFMASLRTHNNCSRESRKRKMDLPKLFKRNYSKNLNQP
jgi:hypothetical protein